MIDHSEAYEKAVISDSRRQFVRVVFDLYDPDMIITNITTNDPTQKTVPRDRMGNLDALLWSGEKMGVI